MYCTDEVSPVLWLFPLCSASPQEGKYAFTIQRVPGPWQALSLSGHEGSTSLVASREKNPKHVLCVTCHSLPFHMRVAEWFSNI